MCSLQEAMLVPGGQEEKHWKEGPFKKEGSQLQGFQGVQALIYLPILAACCRAQACKVPSTPVMRCMDDGKMRFNCKLQCLCRQFLKLLRALHGAKMGLRGLYDWHIRDWKLSSTKRAV